MDSLGVASVAGDLKGAAAAMVDMELGVRVRVCRGAERGKGTASGGLLILGQGARAWRQSEVASGCSGDAGRACSVATG